jgi:putative two-component system response regulator
MGPAAVRALGTAGLLHDLGKVTIPDDILNKPGKLSDDERAVMNRHPVEGARKILEAEEFLDLAAVVAYEHHMRIDGGGYPAFRFSRRCHEGSDLVHVCDVFDALRTNRPYRDAWPMEKVLGYLEEGAGKEFDAGIVQTFVRMMREWGERTAEISGVEEAVPTE